jgi:hypothetical protein
MDEDPWANAWGEPAKSASLPPSTVAWPHKPHDDAHDPEADIAAPSWVTGAEIKWAEPSEDQATLWRPTSPAKVWATSPYEDIKLGTTSSDEIIQEPSTGEPEIIVTQDDHSSVATPHVSTPPRSPSPKSVENESRLASPAPPSPVSLGSASPDGFGTFETGLDADDTDVDPWSKSVVPLDSFENATADPWTPSWGATDSTITETGADGPDEWEAAKRQKERQDQHVVCAQQRKFYIHSDVFLSLPM